MTSAILPAQLIVLVIVNRIQEYAYQAARKAGHRHHVTKNAQIAAPFVSSTMQLILVSSVMKEIVVSLYIFLKHFINSLKTKD